MTWDTCIVGTEGNRLSSCQHPKLSIGPRVVPTMSRTLASWGGGKNLGKTLIAWAVVYPLFLVSRGSFLDRT